MRNLDAPVARESSFGAVFGLLVGGGSECVLVVDRHVSLHRTPTPTLNLTPKNCTKTRFTRNPGILVSCNQ